MANSLKKDRKKWDEKTKTETINKILAGELTYKEARKLLGVQSYQLDAWGGQYLFSTAEKKRRAPASKAPTPDQRFKELLADSVADGSAPSKDAQRAIIEWYIKEFVLGH